MTPAETLAATLNRTNGTATKRGRVKFRFPVCRLREMREALHLNVASVAKAIGVTPQAVYCIEGGQNLSLHTARKLAAFYGKAIEEIWPMEEQPCQPS